MLPCHANTQDDVRRLNEIKDEGLVDMDGVTVEGRMQSLIKQIAEDIKRCANVCDVWSRMRLLARILKAPFWEGTFVNFVNLFAQRRTDLEFAMSMHTARGIDQVSDKLHQLTEMMEERCVYHKAQFYSWLTLAPVVPQDTTSHWLSPDIRPTRSEEPS